ncbi:MAG TPA: hypothetical protein PKE12_08890 [Kiritimatiellia bacterium]|nr:hypothetical protein [Kiritimatiellia bacterium]
MHLPRLHTGVADIDAAFRIALGDLAGNIQPYQGALAARAEPCLLAGLDYDSPWTRDAAFNTWYAGAALAPEAARATLRAVLTRDAHGLRIGGEYWDAVVWVAGAWALWTQTAERDDLQLAFEVARNSLRFFEATERDPRDGLFRGGACFQDGVAGYPDAFADSTTSGIADYITKHPEARAPIGFGLPMKALSTNCLYAEAYRLLALIAQRIGEPEAEWQAKADALGAAIRAQFWNPATGTFRYLLDAGDDPARQEGFGHAFALWFGIATPEQTRSVLARQHHTPHGIPCVWPAYARYTSPDGTTFGRHCGTIWPQVNAAWAAATTVCGRPDLAWQELRLLAAKAARDSQFAEIYHPVDGRIYGGLQEMPQNGKGIIEWTACRRQTWCATGFLHMVTHTLIGLRPTPDGLRIEPWLPPELPRVELTGWPWRGTPLDFIVERTPNGYRVNGKPPAACTL